jgi:hypothetical protein
VFRLCLRAVGGRVPAYLVVPVGRGPFAALLFGHWMMEGSPLKNRRERVGWLAERLSPRRPDFDALARIPPLK